MNTTQFYGIKYPFTTQNSEKYFVDTNSTLKEMARSSLMHVVFTPKGQKVRDPEFGTDLIRYIFEPSDSISWGDVQTEVKEVVKKYVPYITVNKIDVIENENEMREIFVKLDYTIKNGLTEISDSIATTL